MTVRLWVGWIQDESFLPVFAFAHCFLYFLTEDQGTDTLHASSFSQIHHSSTGHTQSQARLGRTRSHSPQVWTAILVVHVSSSNGLWFSCQSFESIPQQNKMDDIFFCLFYHPAFYRPSGSLLLLPLLLPGWCLEEIFHWWFFPALPLSCSQIHSIPASIQNHLPMILIQTVQLHYNGYYDTLLNF